MISIEEFKGYLSIDKNALDTEITQHPELLFKVSEAYAEAAALRDAKKEELAEIDAELDSEIREEAKDEKVTEAIVRNRIQVHPFHAAAFKVYLESKQQADVFSALKEAFSSRGYMLRDLVALFATNYYEQGSVKGSITDDAVYRQRRQTLADARGRRE